METNCTIYGLDGPIRGQLQQFTSKPYTGAMFFVRMMEGDGDEAIICQHIVPCFMIEPDESVVILTNLMTDIIDGSRSTAEHHVSEFDWYNKDNWKREMGLSNDTGIYS